mgnify:CR=1 FL=1
MAYTINKTDGTILATITDGTIDNTSSLTLFGKSYSGFGELLNENLIKLLENQTSTSSPTAPLKGELWFDANTNQLKVYDGSAFKPTGGAKSSATAPTSPSAGDLWMDSDDNQVYVYTGSAWLLVGPAYTSSQTLSGWKIETLAYSGGSAVVSSMYAGNTRVCILSASTFTPTVTQTGFASVKAGLTLNSTLGAVFEGTNTSATYIDVSGTTNSTSSLIAGGNFVRKDFADTKTTKLTLDTDDGIVIGDAQNMTIDVSSNDVSFTQASADKDIIFKINDSDGDGAGTTLMTLDGSAPGVSIVGDVTITGNLNVSGAYDYTTSNIVQHSDAYLKINAGGGDIDSGIIVETPDTNDARIFWDSSENFWTAGYNNSYSQIIRIADTTDDGGANHSTALKSSSAGGLTLDSLTMVAVGSITEGDTSNKNVPTIGAVVTFGDLWGGSAKTVSTSAPSGGSDGDFWFVREA